MNSNPETVSADAAVVDGEPEVIIPEVMKNDDITKDRQFRSMRIVLKHMGVSALAGLVPVPFVDASLISASQLVMLKEISEVYRVPFKKDMGKAFIASMVAGLASMSVARFMANRVFTKIPVIGPVMKVITYPWLASAATYAVGKVFIHHYELGGTLLDFQPEKTRAYLEQLYKEGRLVTRRHNDIKSAFFSHTQSV